MFLVSSSINVLFFILHGWILSGQTFSSLQSIAPGDPSQCNTICCLLDALALDGDRNLTLGNCLFGPYDFHLALWVRAPSEHCRFPKTSNHAPESPTDNM